jgi:hypothetical protein
MPESLEREKLSQANARTENWQRWGTYLPERQWGTLQEDYSTDGNSWSYLTYEKSRHKAYRWAKTGCRAWESLLLFPEYFCGDTGRGAGRSHQTGSTSLIAGGRCDLVSAT